jgi:hypothetical protein
LPLPGWRFVLVWFQLRQQENTTALKGRGARSGVTTADDAAAAVVFPKGLFCVSCCLS